MKGSRDVAKSTGLTRCPCLAEGAWREIPQNCEGRSDILISTTYGTMYADCVLLVDVRDFYQSIYVYSTGEDGQSRSDIGSVVVIC